MGSVEKGTIVVVDDEDNIADLVGLYLEREGFRVLKAPTGDAGLEAFRTHRPRLVVLDVGLPDVDGLEVCKRIRQTSRVPIIFLTARDGEVDRVLGLELGADDYLTKPFSPAELVARVQAILRRTSSELPGDVLNFADLTLDESRHEVFRGETPVALTATEFNLLRYFMLNPRRVLSKAQILDHVWDYDFNGDYNVVETFVSYLRKKLDRLGPPLIHTIRLVGYSLRTGE